MADAPDKPVYLLTGSDRPKIDTALARLRRHFAPEAIEVVSALDTPGDAVVALCDAGSLFGDARLVIAEDVDGRRDGEGRLKGGWKAADVEAVGPYLKSPAPATVLMLVGEDVKKNGGAPQGVRHGRGSPRVRRRQGQGRRLGGRAVPRPASYLVSIALQ